MNKQFSDEINKLNSISLFDESTLTIAQTYVSKRIYNKLKKLKKNSFQTAINRQTVTLNELVTKNLKLAVKIANDYFENTGAKRKAKCEYNDVLQAANLGLVKAAQQYIDTKDGEYKDWSFAPIAKIRIKKEVLDFINYGCNAIKFTQDEAHTVGSSCKIYSVDASFSTGDDEMASPILNELRAELQPDELNEIKHNIETREYLMSKLFSILRPDELAVIKCLYGFDSDCGKNMSLPEVKKKLKIGIRHIEDLRDDAFLKLRDSDLTQSEIATLINTTNLWMPKDEFYSQYSDIIDLSDWSDMCSTEVEQPQQNIQLFESVRGLVTPDIATLLISKANIVDAVAWLDSNTIDYIETQTLDEEIIEEFENFTI